MENGNLLYGERERESLESGGDFKFNSRGVQGGVVNCDEGKWNGNEMALKCVRNESPNDIQDFLSGGKGVYRFHPLDVENKKRKKNSSLN